MIDDRVRAIFEDRYGTFYVGTAGDGLNTMDRKTGKFIRHPYDPNHPEKLSRQPLRKNVGFGNDHITFINEDVTGAVWIGSIAGFTRYYPRTGKVKYFEYLSDSTAKIKDNIGWSAYNSRDGVLWLSTIGRGNIYHIDPTLRKIEHVDLGDQVNCIYKKSPGIYWIGTQFSG